MNGTPPRSSRLPLVLIGCGAAVGGMMLAGLAVAIGYWFLRPSPHPAEPSAPTPPTIPVTPDVPPPPRPDRPPPPVATERDLVVADDAVSVIMPPGSIAEGEQIRTQPVPDPPAPPEGLEPVGRAYRVEPPPRLAGQSLPALVRLPLPDPSVADDPGRAVFIGRHDGTDWEVLPADVVEGYAVARVDRFSQVMVLLGIRRDTPGPEKLASLRIGAPVFLGFEIMSSGAYAILDISPCRTATTGRFFSQAVAVSRLKVYVARPTATQPVPRQQDLAPYRRYDEEVTLEANRGTKLLALSFDETPGLDVGPDTVVSDNRLKWIIALAPIFADGSEGMRSDRIYIPAGVARAMLNLREGLRARLTEPQAEAFTQLTIRNSYYVFPETQNEHYFQAGAGVRTRIQSMVWTGLLPYSFIEMGVTSEFDRVVSHEWGHYATNLIYGDADFAQFSGGAHAAWLQADSRALAMSEDLATFFGQMGTGSGYPSAAGAARGNLSRYAHSPDGSVAGQWPGNKNMDAARVESVPATILGRVARMHTYSTVHAFLRTTHPMDILQFFNRWYLAEGMPERSEVDLQIIYLEEGVAWKVKGTVVGVPFGSQDPPQPIPGARVRARSVDDPVKYLGSEAATTTADGSFELTVPPGPVRFEVVAAGWLEPAAGFQSSPDLALATNAPAQEMPPFQMEPAAPPVLHVTSPSMESPQVTVTEEVLTVAGTVEGTKDGTPEGEPIDTVRIVVEGQSFTAEVSGGSFSQAVLLKPGPNVVRVIAENPAGRDEKRVTVMAEIQATVLKVILTWSGGGTDVDLWVTDPGGIRTGYTNKTPAEGRELDIDDQDGYGPETYTMTRPIRGRYQVRINYYRGGAPQSFTVRWVAWEGTTQERRGERRGSVSDADQNGSKPTANYRFVIEVP